MLFAAGIIKLLISVNLSAALEIKFSGSLSTHKSQFFIYPRVDFISANMKANTEQDKWVNCFLIHQLPHLLTFQLSFDLYRQTRELYKYLWIISSDDDIDMQ